jgi:hypothetical protein
VTYYYKYYYYYRHQDDMYVPRDSSTKTFRRATAIKVARYLIRTSAKGAWERLAYIQHR